MRAGNAKSKPTAEDRIVLPAANVDGHKLAPYGRDVAAAVASGKCCNTYIFAGTDAWERAKARRNALGPASALVLPTNCSPLDLKWPPVPHVVVAWPTCTDIERKFDLARALIRDGIQVVHIEHYPVWLRARAKVNA
jgi:hypothetical protein